MTTARSICIACTGSAAAPPQAHTKQQWGSVLSSHAPKAHLVGPAKPTDHGPPAGRPPRARRLQRRRPTQPAPRAPSTPASQPSSPCTRPLIVPRTAGAPRAGPRSSSPCPLPCPPFSPAHVLGRLLLYRRITLPSRLIKYIVPKRGQGQNVPKTQISRAIEAIEAIVKMRFARSD